MENALIDDSYEIAGGRTINHLTFPNVGRQHLKARLICQATNNNLVPPVTKVVILDINCKYLVCERNKQSVKGEDKYCESKARTENCSAYSVDFRRFLDFGVSKWGGICVDLLPNREI